MGTPLTGSTVASTYTGLLKTSDNATITSTLKSLGDGGGNDSALQVSTTAVNTTGDFSVATSKFTVAASSGNTVIIGTLNVTGATTLSGNLSVPGTLSVNGATSLSSLSTSGAATIGTTLGVTGASTLASLGVTGAATIGTTLGVTGATTLSSVGVTGAATIGTTLGVTGASNLSTLATSGAATIGGTLGVTGDATLSSNLSVTGNATVNGDTTIGNASTDLLTVNSNNVTFPNMPAPVTVDLANDKVLIEDASDGDRIRVIDASALGINASNAPQIKQKIFRGTAEYPTTTASPGVEITDLTVSITPRTSASNVLVTASINYSKKTAANWSYYAVFKLTRTVGGVVTELGTSTTGANLAGIAPIVYYNDSDTNLLNNVTFQFMDTLSSTSTATYKVHVYSPGLTDTFILNTTPSATAGNLSSPSIARVSSSLTLQEYFA